MPGYHQISRLILTQKINFIVLVMMSVMIALCGPLSQLTYAQSLLEEKRTQNLEIIDARIQNLKDDRDRLQAYRERKKDSTKEHKFIGVSDAEAAKLITALDRQTLALQDLRNKVNSENDLARMRQLGKSIDIHYGLNFLSILQAKTVVAIESINLSLEKSKAALNDTSEKYDKLKLCADYLLGTDAKASTATEESSNNNQSQSTASSGSSSQASPNANSCDGLDPKKVSRLYDYEFDATLKLSKLSYSTTSTILRSIASLADAQLSQFNKRVDSIESKIGKGGLASLSSVLDNSRLQELIDNVVGNLEATRTTFSNIAKQLGSVVASTKESLNNVKELSVKLVENIKDELGTYTNAIRSVTKRVGEFSDYGDRGAGEAGKFVRWQKTYSSGYYNLYCAVDVSRVGNSQSTQDAGWDLQRLCDRRMPDVQGYTGMTYHYPPIQVLLVGEKYSDGLINDKSWCSKDTKRNDIAKSKPNEGRIYVCAAGSGYLENNPSDTSWIIKEMTRMTQSYLDKSPKQWFTDAIPIYVQKKLNYTKNEETVICSRNQTYTSSPICAAAFLQYLTKYNSLLIRSLDLQATIGQKNVNDTLGAIVSIVSRKDKKDYKSLDEIFEQGCKNDANCMLKQ